MGRFWTSKRFGEDCKNDWLLNIDADEYLTDEIKDQKYYKSFEWSNHYNFNFFP